ncbi:Ribosome-associated complex subunit SSZ1 [Candida viswanathii]|uniref:Ribosome-associated complex subunit SSZ1 n=1 Tax=Candida viswanathii TaxID=5486 RepID=A0A367XT82_9ASCO|nr:Ribosome-associated complex subunit SSZ1 [Candida viswanathii]
MSVIGITFGNTSSSIAVAALTAKSTSLPTQTETAEARLIRNPENTIVNFRTTLAKVHEIDATHTTGPSLRKSTGNQLRDHERRRCVDCAYDFTEHQREEITKIAEDAGLKVSQLINEPSAALIAHLSAEEDRLSQDKLYVVADFGGIRTDGAVIAVRGGVLTILATAHEYGLGGDKLDASLSEFFAKEFEKKTKANPRTNARSLAKLKADPSLSRRRSSLIESFDESEIKESLQPIVVNTQHLSKPIGIKDAEGKFQPILVTETAYPIKKSIEVTNGDAASVVVELYEGARTVKETVIEPEPVEDSEEEDSEEEEPEVKREVVMNVVTSWLNCL